MTTPAPTVEMPLKVGDHIEGVGHADSHLRGLRVAGRIESFGEDSERAPLIRLAERINGMFVCYVDPATARRIIKPAPPPPIAESDRLHETGCCLCGADECANGVKFDGLCGTFPRHFEWQNVGARACNSCRSRFGDPVTRAAWDGADAEITRRKKLLAQDSPGSAGLRDVTASQPSEPARPDPYQNFPHGMNDAQVAVVMSAIDARRSRQKREVLADMRRDVPTWRDKMARVVSFWGKK